MPFGYELLVIVLMLVFNAIFAAYEMALASISQSRIKVLVNEKRKGAGEAAFMKERIEASLAIVQLGITLLGAIAAATGGAFVQDAFAPYIHNNWGVSELFAEILSLVFLVVPLTFFTMVFAELVPKMLALNNKERVVLRLSPAMKFLAQIAYPIVSVTETIVKKTVAMAIWKRNPIISDDKAKGLYELKAAVSIARTSKLLGAREEKIVLSAAQMSSRPVRSIMLPASDIMMIYAESTLMDALVSAHKDMHTRFPICAWANDPQSITGYINFKDIVVALRINPQNPTIKGITRQIMRVSEDMSLSSVLEKMMQEKTHIAIVCSKENVVLGMVTLEDIIEELVGEIEDEFDRWLTHIQPYGSSFIMGGGVSMTKVASTLGLDWSGKFPDGRVPSLSEWCEAKIGRPLTGGELIEGDSLRVVPRKFRRKKMSEAIVSISSADSN